MVKEAHPRKRHDHIVPVRRLDNEVVADGATGLYDVFHAALKGALDIVAERKKCVAREGDPRDLGEKRPLLRRGERLGANGEILLPYALPDHVLRLLREVEVDDVIPVGSPEALAELQSEDLIRLPQEEEIRFLTRETGAMDAALLPRSHADRLSVIGETNGI